MTDETVQLVRMRHYSAKIYSIMVKGHLYLTKGHAVVYKKTYNPREGGHMPGLRVFLRQVSSLIWIETCVSNLEQVQTEWRAVNGSSKRKKPLKALTPGTLESDSICLFIPIQKALPVHRSGVYLEEWIDERFKSLTAIKRG